MASLLRRWPLLLFCHYCVPALAADNAHVFTPVTYTGQSVPGVPGTIWTTAPEPVLGKSGSIAIAATIPGAAGNEDSALWSGTPMNPQLIFREGAQVLGMPAGTRFSLIADSWNLGPSGHLLTTNYFSDGVVGGAGVWSVPPGQASSRVFLSSGPAPGLSPDYTLWSAAGGLKTDGFGDVFFLNPYKGPGVTQNTQDALWGGPPNEVRAVARGGTEAAGIPGASYFGIFSTPAVASSGSIAFTTGLSAPAVPYNDSGIWSGTFGGVNLVVREGAQAPGALPGQLLRRFEQRVAVNSSGQVIFQASIGGTGNNELWGTGLWTGKAGSLTLLALSPFVGVPKPPDILYSGGSNPVINDAGQVAFACAANMPSGARPAIVAGMSDDLHVVTMSGNHAPDLETDVLFSFTPLEPRPLINDVGDIVFMSGLTGPGITTENDRGIWYGTIGDEMHLLIREGDELIVGGVPRTISSLQLFSPPSELRQVLFYAQFADGTSASLITTIPEASPTLLSLLGAWLVCIRARRSSCRRRGTMIFAK